MEKVRHVGESYELHKYKTLNKTIELDAKLANERLVAVKLRLGQVSLLNDKLGKQLRSLQQEYRAQEKKLLLAETMLRQMMSDSGNNNSNAHRPSKTTSTTNNHQHQEQQQVATSKTGNKQARLTKSKIGRLQESPTPKVLQFQSMDGRRLMKPTAARLSPSGTAIREQSLMMTRAHADATDDGQTTAVQQQVGAGGGNTVEDSKQMSSSSTQTAQRSRTHTIINDLRQRLNLAVGSKSGECHHHQR